MKKKKKGFITADNGEAKCVITGCSLHQSAPGDGPKQSPYFKGYHTDWLMSISIIAKRRTGKITEKGTS